MATVTLTIVRHGQTKANLENVVQSGSGDLTDFGIIMAESLGKYLAEEKFSFIYSSDLYRCQQTSQYILKHIKSPPKQILFEEILRERDIGDLEKLPKNIVQESMKKSGLPFYSTPILGGESFEDVKERCAKFFNTICKIADNAESDENILVITHGGWMLCFFEYLFSKQSLFQLENFNKNVALSRIENTARTKMRISQLPPNSLNKRRIEFFTVHNISHLDDLKN